jgi:UDP-N-acetylglucosamine 4,6-dehydratase/5-epimerase
MKKILITGGTGTVGRSFIKEYYNDYEFYSISRNETDITELLREFPNVTCHIGNICDLDHMINLFCKIKPDIVIHTAALKHINLAEENPTSAIEINVVGSSNIAKASVRADVPLTVGVSTDKACNPDSVYGYTKRMMETMFMQYNNDKTRFVCTRFANVANSNGSVIPFWISEAKKDNPLKLTDPDMNRLMFSKKESVQLIHRAIDYVKVGIDGSFILCKIMKNVNLLELASLISDKKIDIVGKRPGEKLNETLISKKELPNTKVSNDYVFIFDNKVAEHTLQKEHSSLTAETMSKEEMKELILS